MNYFRRLHEKIRDGFIWSYNDSEPYFSTYCSISLCFLIFYYLNFLRCNHDVHYIYDDVSLRYTAAIFIIPMIFHRYWPKQTRKFLPWYWYFVLVYSQPFFSSFMMLMNPLSNVWHVNGIICLLTLSLFVDTFSLLIIAILGVTGGTGYFLLKKTASFEIFPNELRQTLYYYVAPIIYIILFSRKQKKFLRHKINSMKMTAEFIAHELRTPLATMTMASQALVKLFPHYFLAYKQAKKYELPIKKLNHQQEKHLADLPSTLENVSKNANLMLSILITNLNEQQNFQKLDRCSMAACIQEALNTYPFSENDRKLVHWQKNPREDFFFKGHFDLTKHVLFNLLKNALHSLSKKGEGTIHITIEPSKKNKSALIKPFHRLIFKDTGTGIASDKLPLIFDRFYSDKELGAGIGLTFCKSIIENYGGKIFCTSQLGAHTTFIISLPVIDIDP